MRFLFIPIILLIFAISAGCSKTIETTSPSNNSSSNEISSNLELLNPNSTSYGILFVGSMKIDPDNQQIHILDRYSTANIDITGFLGSNFKFNSLSYLNEEMKINLEITNPSSLQVYDVRLIFTELYGKKVLNPDNYTSLFAESGLFSPNPQIAFTKHDDNRAFPIGPGATDSQILELHFPTGANPQIDFKIVASFPDQCREPYEIFEKWVDSTLTPSGGSAYLSVRFKDHQFDVLTVACDSRVFNGSLSFLDYMYATDRYAKTITNDLNAPPGLYRLLVGGISPGSDVILYDYIDVLVSSDTLEFEPPRDIHDPSYPGYNPDLITQGGKGINGFGDDIYIIYYVTDPFSKEQVQLLRSTSNGDSFHYPATQVNTEDPNSIHISPAMTVTPDGNIHAIWIRGDLEGFGSNLEYSKSTDRGLSFNPDVYMSGFFFELFTDIAAYGNDNIYTLRNGAPTGRFSMYFQSSYNGGNSWSPDRDIALEAFPSSPWDEMFPVMETDSKGNIFIAFVSNYLNTSDPNQFNVYLTRSTDMGNSFSSALNFEYGENPSVRLPSVACDNNDRIYVMWVDMDSSTKDSIRLAYSDDSGVSFYPSYVIDDVPGSANAPVMRIDPNTNELYVGYVANGIRVQRSPDGISWSNSVEVSTTGYHLNMYVDNNSRLHVSWGENGLIKYSRNIK